CDWSSDVCSSDLEFPMTRVREGPRLTVLSVRNWTDRYAGISSGSKRVPHEHESSKWKQGKASIHTRHTRGNYHGNQKNPRTGQRAGLASWHRFHHHSESRRKQWAAGRRTGRDGVIGHQAGRLSASHGYGRTGA